MNKSAELIARLGRLEKRAASPESSYIGNALINSVPYSQLVQVPGMVAGMVASPNDDYTDNTWLDFVPGAAAYRQTQRMRAPGQELADKGNLNPYYHELLGGISSSLVGAGLGGLAGHALGSLSDNEDARVPSALLGSMLGAHLPGGLGALAALFTSTRTPEEQKEHDKNKSLLGNYLIPGLSFYNLHKRLGSTRAADAAAREEEKRLKDLARNALAEKGVSGSVSGKNIRSISL